MQYIDINGLKHYDECIKTYINNNSNNTEIPTIDLLPFIGLYLNDPDIPEKYRNTYYYNGGPESDLPEDMSTKYYELFDFLSTLSSPSIIILKNYINPIDYSTIEEDPILCCITGSVDKNSYGIFTDMFYITIGKNWMGMYVGCYGYFIDIHTNYTSVTPILNDQIDNICAN